jgi:glycosyltransferase involved in cell wall biosynthesis
LQKRHVLHVIDALNHGGAQNLLVQLAEGIHRDLYEMTVCALQPDLALKETLESRGVKVLCLQRQRPSIFSPHRFIAYLYRNIRDIESYCRSNAIDVLHGHLSDAEFLGILAGHLASVGRLLTTVHYPALLPERRICDFRNWLRRLWTKTVYHRWADCVVAVSEDIASKLVRDFGIHREKIRVILNGVNLPAFERADQVAELKHSLSLTGNHRIIVNVARLAPPKGQEYLLEAVGRLLPRFPELVLLLVGDGELRQPLEEQRSRLGLKDHVRFLGNRSDVAALLALSELFVFPSVSEGTSLALLEAMASKRAIVATAIPGNEEVIHHQETGYLVPPCSSEALADGIEFLLENRNIADGCGERAHHFVRKHFDIRRTIEAYEALWSVP